MPASFPQPLLSKTHKDRSIAGRHLKHLDSRPLAIQRINKAFTCSIKISWKDQIQTCLEVCFGSEKNTV